MKFKSLPTYSGKKVKVDRENSKIHDVKIADHGDNKNGTYFDDKFIHKLTELGNEQSQGVKSRFGHPNMCATSLGTYIGRYKNYSVTNRSAYADLELDAITKKTQVEGKGITMFDYVMDMAENNPDAFGNSIVVRADEYEDEIENEKGEKESKYFLDLQAYPFSDLVGEPAATDHLFENYNDIGVNLTSFLDDNPDIFKVIDKNPAIISDFFQRYKNYRIKNDKSINMSLLDRIKKQFGKKYDVDLTLINGNIITVQTDNEEPQEGDQVVDQEGASVPDEDHETEDGRVITTVDGAITNITSADDGNNDDGDIENSIKKERQDRKAFEKEVGETFEFFTKQLNEINAQIFELNKNLRSDYRKPSGENPKKVNNKDTFADKVEARREEIKNRKK